MDPVQCKAEFRVEKNALVLRIQNGGLTRLDYTARHGETSRVFLDMAHLQPEFYLQMGKSFNISFNFMFFRDPRRSESIRVDPN